MFEIQDPPGNDGPMRKAAHGPQVQSCNSDHVARPCSVTPSASDSADKIRFEAMSFRDLWNLWAEPLCISMYHSLSSSILVAAS